MSRRILIVDDDTAIRMSLGEALAESGVEISHAHDSAAALALLDKVAPDLASESNLILLSQEESRVERTMLLDLVRKRFPIVVQQGRFVTDDAGV